MRAAGATTALRRPVSYAGHFLGVARFDAVDLGVRSLRRTRRAESLDVRVIQDGDPVLEALVWAIDDHLGGLEHAVAVAPDVPRPDAVPSMAERFANLPDRPGPPLPFWENIELRACDWIDDWEHRAPGDTRERSWYRLVPRGVFADPFLEAGRVLLVLDTCMWPAASRGHPGNHDWYAPSLDVQARFHALPADEWLLADAWSPLARDGLVGGTASVWDGQGALVATGGQQMLCRPLHAGPPNVRGATVVPAETPPVA